MSAVRRFFWNGRVGWGALIVLLGAALPSARADVITGTDSNGTPVSILVNFFNQDGAVAPLVLTNNGGTVTLTLPENGPGNYGLLFGMTAGNHFLNFQELLNNPHNTPEPPDPVTGQFPPYRPEIGGKIYTIAGSLHTSNPIDQNSWNAIVIPGYPGFHQVGLFTFSTTGDPMMTFSVDDPNGNVIHFTDPGAPNAPEPASLALAGLGLVGLAGYGWRRRFAV